MDLMNRLNGEAPTALSSEGIKREQENETLLLTISLPTKQKIFQIFISCQSQPYFIYAFGLMFHTISLCFDKLMQTVLMLFDKELQLIIGSPYAEIELLLKFLDEILSA